jgi:transcriptional regulator with XRE-family HTH domain
MKSGPDQLRDWMGRRGFNQTEMAVYFGWPQALVSYLLNGQRSPGLRKAIKIERETGIPVEAWTLSSLHESDDDAPTTVGNVQHNKA